MRAGRGVRVGRRARLEVLHGGLLILADGCRIGERTRIVVHGGRVEIGAGGDLDVVVGDDRAALPEPCLLYTSDAADE